MAAEKEDETLRIVPLGAVGPETVAAVAHGLRRLGRTRVEIVAPRRVLDARPEALLARVAERTFERTGADVSFGIVEREVDAPSFTQDREHGTYVLVLPLRRAANALGRALERAYAVMSGEPVPHAA
jgi:hypothetical protein